MDTGGRLERSLFSAAYNHFLELLREARSKAGLTQAEAADRFKKPQSFISKCESGERRVDVVEFIEFCRVYGADPSDIMRRLEKRARSKR
jgi:transcriptional regulator with XRE-family HTH domain